MSWGWCGVDLFFVLSGFLITGILLDTKNAENRYRSFYSRRILRTFPLYYSVVLLSLTASLLLHHSVLNRALGPGPAGWAAYLLYVQNWWMPFGDLHHMRFLGPLWSLAIEEQFYLVWPVCVCRVSTKALMMICGLGMLGSFLLRLCLSPHLTAALSYVVYANTLTRLDGLLAGAVCAIAVGNPTLLRMRKALPAAAVAVVSGIALLVLTGHVAWNDPEVLIYAHLLFAIGFGCLILSAYFQDGSGSLFDRVFRSKWLGVFGKYSYEIYVYQGIVLEFTLDVFRRRQWWGHSFGGALVLAIAWVAISVFIAFLSYELFEKRFLRLRRPYPASPLGPDLRGSARQAGGTY